MINPEIIIQCPLDSKILPPWFFKKTWCQIFWCCAVNPTWVPETSFISFARCNYCWCIEQISITLITRDIKTNPRSTIELPLEPAPSKSKCSRQPLKIEYPKATHILWSANSWPFYLTISATYLLGFFPLPKETSPHVVNLLDEPLLSWERPWSGR
jgi:hypothetical protein